MMHELRGFVIDGRYKQLHMSDAQPRMIASKLHGECKGVIQNYVDNRDSILAKVQLACECDKRVAKELFLRIMYGGTPRMWCNDHSLKSPPDFVHRFADAITGIGAQLESENDALFEKCKKIAKHKRAALKRQVGDEWRSTALALYLQHRKSEAIEKDHRHSYQARSDRGRDHHDSVIVPASCNVDVELIDDAVCENFNLEFKFKCEEFEKGQEWYNTLVEGSDYNDNGRPDLNEFEQAIVEATSCNEQPAADVFKLCHPWNFVWLGSERQWVVFMQPRWVKVSHAHKVKNIYDTLVGSFTQFAAKLSSGDVQAEGVTMAPVLKKLQTISFKDTIEKELRSVYDVVDPQLLLDKLDEVTYVIGFEDVVYDFREKRFRKGLPEDFVTMSSGHSIHTRPDSSIQDKIAKIFEEVIPDDESVF
jgi:hypothetical protein